MEVMLATAILLGCTVVLVELSNQGRRNSMAALDQATAQSICLAYVNEMLAGIRLVEPQEPQISDEYPGWTIGVEVLPLDQQGLSAVTVTVEQEENKLGKLQSFSLTRWVANAQDQEFFSPEFPSGSPGSDFPAQEDTFSSLPLGTTDFDSEGGLR